MRDLKGRTVAITGAASGIGRSLARLLLSEGCHLALADIRISQLTELKVELESGSESSDLRVSIHQVDVSDAEQVQRFAHEAIEHHQSVHLLINNAGVTYMGNFLAHDLATWDHIIRVNLMGVVHGCHAFIPHMLTLDQAHIVNLSSIFGIVGVPGQSAYCSAKFAVSGLSESLSAELTGSSVAITVVHPGGISTEIVNHSESAHPEHKEHLSRVFKKMMSPDRAAELIVQGVKKRRRRVLITSEAHLGDRLKRLMPIRGGALFFKLISRALRLDRLSAYYTLKATSNRRDSD